MKIRDLGGWTKILTVMIIVDALWNPLVLGMAYLFPAMFSQFITPIANIVDGGSIAFSILTMIFFACWMVRAGRNLEIAGLGELEFTPAARIWWFAVPFANLVKPFQGMRELWNASRGIWPYDTSESLIGIWWALWLARGFIGWITLRAGSGVTPLLIQSASDIAVGIAAILLIRGITAGQRNLDAESLNEVFA